MVVVVVAVVAVIVIVVVIDVVVGTYEHGMNITIPEGTREIMREEQAKSCQYK